MAECCRCGDSGLTLLYACSGAANTGLLADRVMRTLSAGGNGKGTCLAAVGADLSGFVESAKGACKNIVLDGCRVACGAKIMERHGLAFEHYVMTDYGVEKGRTEITDELVESIAERIAAEALA